MRLKSLLFILFAAFAIQASAQSSSENKPDPRIKAKLESLGLKYTISELGNFKVVFQITKDRTQLVMINSKTYEYEGLEIREIYSASAMVSDKSSFTQKNLFTLLVKNETYKIGAWQIAEVDSKYRLEFGLRIRADAGKSELENLLQLAAKTADEMETQLTDGDEF